jgi:DNA-binding transcriptional ArsR family regulator
MNEKQLQLFKMQAEICKTMADPKRLMMVEELRNGELSVGELGARLGLPQANVSQHLSILRKRGIVATRRKGTTIGCPGIRLLMPAIWYAAYWKNNWNKVNHWQA